MLVACGAAAACLVLTDPRARLVAMAIALVAAPVLVLGNVWDDDFEGDPNIVEVYIRHLRNKLDRPFGRCAIETVRGAGYRLAEDGG